MGSLLALTCPAQLQLTSLSTWVVKVRLVFKPILEAVVSHGRPFMASCPVVLRHKFLFHPVPRNMSGLYNSAEGLTCSSAGETFPGGSHSGAN